MKLTVLGCSPAFPHPGGACSGYLVEEGESALLLDCGTGVLANLLKYLDFRQLSAIVISHMHADHFLDLIPLRYGLKFARPPAPRLRLYLPPGGQAVLEAVMRPILELAPSRSEAPETFFTEYFDIREYDPQGNLQVGAFAVRFAPVVHYVPSYALAIEGRRRLAYSGDSGPCPELEALARGADLFVCEATLASAGGGGQWGHLTARGAGEMARRAGVGSLVITHVWRDRPQDSLPEAQAAFGPEVELAEEGKIFLV